MIHKANKISEDERYLSKLLIIMTDSGSSKMNEK